MAKRRMHFITWCKAEKIRDVNFELTCFSDRMVQ